MAGCITSYRVHTGRGVYHRKMVGLCGLPSGVGAGVCVGMCGCVLAASRRMLACITFNDPP